MWAGWVQGPSFMKIWTCGSSPRSGSWNAWTWIKNIKSASRLTKFWNFFGAIQMISCCNCWPWMKPGYIIMTQRQSNNQCSGGIAAHFAQNNLSPKIHWKCSCPDFFGMKTASSSLIIFRRTKLSTWSITHLCWCNWRTFWKKNAVGRSPRGFCSCTTMPWLTGHLQPRRNWPTWASKCLDQPPYSPDLALSDYHLFPELKKQLKGRHFPTNAEVIAAESWIFFEWLAKVRATG